MTPYAKRLLKYAMDYCPIRQVRKGKTKAELRSDREQWAVNFLNAATPNWQQLKSQPKAIKLVSSATTDEDDEC
ncbi:hypothetical protein KFE26_13870 [Shewanella sp. M16]|uniref:hypothetical protein n=1 Tax=Shewanella TaxID=22 RepID=UPI001BAEF46B|nr:hypothetical protein [Shewanella sp. M16]MBS0043379.1 hypothetical protein [Shewanella sp. M16]QYW06200.1 hypothetical protein MuM161_p11 [Shewanella phage vB_SspS_MuM16-1]